MADEPIIAWNNYIDGAVIVAENGALESAGLPPQNLANWDNLSPAAFTPSSTTLSVVIGFDQPADAADLLILGAARHDTAGNRSFGGSVNLDGYTGAGTTQVLVLNQTLTGVAQASLHKFTKTAIVPDVDFNATPTPFIQALRVRWLAGRFFGMGNDGSGAFITHSDGLGFSAAAATITDAFATVHDMAWDGASTLCAVGDTGNAYISNDGGLTWTNNVIAAAVAMGGITYGAGVFVATPSAAGTTVYTSPDGATWSARTLAASVTNKLVSYGNGQFVLVGNAGAIQTSPDGITWTAQTSGTANQITDVVFGGEWVAVTAVGESVTSQDAITWTVTTAIGGASSCGHVTFADGEYKATGVVTHGAVLRSTDGITWTAEIPASFITPITIASNGIADFTYSGGNTTYDTKVIKSAYRMVIYVVTAGQPWQLPELFLGPRLTMPFVEFGYDPYVEVFKGNTFNAESGRQFTTLHYRRVELKPRWRVIPTADAVAVDAFRENHLELRKPFWFAWKPDTARTETYMCRHKGETALMPISSAIHRGFSLDLIEAL